MRRWAADTDPEQDSAAGQGMGSVSSAQLWSITLPFVVRNFALCGLY